MKLTDTLIGAAVALALTLAAWSAPASAGAGAAEPAPLDPARAQAEIAEHYAAAHPEVQEFVRHTARSFGRSGLWLNDNAFAALTEEQRTQHTNYLIGLLWEGEYGRHLCRGLAHASAIEDPRLVPGLMVVAAHHDAEADYDCRPKWMAVAALARQDLMHLPPMDGDEANDAGDSDSTQYAVSLLVGLVDHGNQNTRFWARAALARHTGQDFGDDKNAWARWWVDAGHEPIDAPFLKPWTPPVDGGA